MAEIPILPGADTPEPIPIIPGGPQPSPPKPAPLIGTPAPPKPAPPVAPTENPSEGNGGGLADLPILALLIIALALALIASYFTDFLNWLLRTALGPFGSKGGPKQLDPIATTQALSNAMGRAVSGIDKQMGVHFTRLAQTTGMLGATLTAIGELIYKLAGAISGLEHNTTGVRQAQAQMRAAVRKVEQLERGAAQRIAADERAAAAKHHALGQQIQELQHHVTHVLEPELEALRGRIPKLERGATVAWSEIKKHEELLGLGAFTAATAVAMGRLGAGWTRCETTQTIGRELCRSNPDTFRRLLRDGLGLLGIVELCASVKLIAAAGQNPVLIEGLGLFSVGVEDLLKCTGATRPPPLKIPPPSLGPVQRYAALAPVTA